MSFVHARIALQAVSGGRKLANWLLSFKPEWQGPLDNGYINQMTVWLRLRN